MANEFKGEKGTFPGYCIVEDKYIEALEEKVRLLEAQIPKSEFTKAIENAYDKPLQSQEF